VPQPCLKIPGEEKHVHLDSVALQTNLEDGCFVDVVGSGE
jgi:hypothetical protein